MSNEWNTNSRIWETPPPLNPANSSTTQSYYGAPGQYYNAPPQQYQQTAPSVSGYSFNPATLPPVVTGGLQQDTSLVLKAVNKLNLMGGLDIDPTLISELSKHIRNDSASDQPAEPEIYSPTFNSPSPSPERKSSSAAFEVDGKKLVSSKPFYEQFNHYEDDTSKVNESSTYASNSRTLDRRVERTWAGSVSPPQRHGVSKSPIRVNRSSRYDEHHSSARSVRSRSPVKRIRSRSRENVRTNKLGDPNFKEKVINLLGMSKSENRKFVEAQQSSSVLLVMNLDTWITDKVLWGAIHKYAREYGTKPPFYIERATFNVSTSLGDSNLALIAFTTIAAAEMCMMHTKCELEVTGRQRKMFKMMYYNENTIMFDALSHKFVGIWRAVLKKRIELLRKDSDDDDDDKEAENNERKKSRERSPHRDSRDKSRERPSRRNDRRSRERSSHRSDRISRDRSRSRDRFSRRSESRNNTTDNIPDVKSTDDDKITDNSSVTVKTPVEVETPSEQKLVVEEKPPEATKPQVNIIKTNVLIGKMKSYLLKQNKIKPEKCENDNQIKKPDSTKSIPDQKSMTKQENLRFELKDIVSSQSRISLLPSSTKTSFTSDDEFQPSKTLPPLSEKERGFDKDMYEQHIKRTADNLHEKSSDRDRYIPPTKRGTDHFNERGSDRDRYAKHTKRTTDNFNESGSDRDRHAPPTKRDTDHLYERGSDRDRYTQHTKRTSDNFYERGSDKDRYSRPGKRHADNFNERGSDRDKYVPSTKRSTTDSFSSHSSHISPHKEIRNENNKTSRSEELFPTRRRVDGNSRAESSVSNKAVENTKKSNIEQEKKVESTANEGYEKTRDTCSVSERESLNIHKVNSDTNESVLINLKETKNDKVHKDEYAEMNISIDIKQEPEESKTNNDQVCNTAGVTDDVRGIVQKKLKQSSEKCTSKRETAVVGKNNVDGQKEIKLEPHNVNASKKKENIDTDTEEETKGKVEKNVKQYSDKSEKNKEQVCKKNAPKDVPIVINEEIEYIKTNKSQASNIIDTKNNVQKNLRKDIENSETNQASNILNTKVDVSKRNNQKAEKSSTNKNRASNVVDSKDIKQEKTKSNEKHEAINSITSKDEDTNIFETEDIKQENSKNNREVVRNIVGSKLDVMDATHETGKSITSREQVSNIAPTKVDVLEEEKQEAEQSKTNKEEESNTFDRKENDRKESKNNHRGNDKEVITKPNDSKEDFKVTKVEIEAPQLCDTVGTLEKQPQKKCQEIDSNESKKLKDANNVKIVNKRKLKDKEEPPRSSKLKKEDKDDLDDLFNPAEDDLIIPIGEDPESAREREEDEAELFGKGLDRYRKRNRRNRSPDELTRGFGRNRRDGNYREDRLGYRGGMRGGFRGGRHDNRGGYDTRREENCIDDIDGNEESYWTSKTESSKQSGPVNPWVQNEGQVDKVSLSLKELRDPEFLLRVLLQTSIMIQNNQLTMANPLDALTPTDKELIIQTLNEIEATSEVVTYATLNDKTKFNAAENRVLLEALSNIHMFKAALLPPGSLNVDDQRHKFDRNRDFKLDSSGENKKEGDVHVQMSNIKKWTNKNHVIRYLRSHNISFEFVKIYPINPGDSLATGFIKFKDTESANELLKGSNCVMYIGNDRDGIQLSMSEITKKVNLCKRWTCNSCSMKNSFDTIVCLKCQKLKEKLRDVNVTTDVTNRLVLINFKITTTIDELKQILTKVAPFLNANIVSHVDSLSDQVMNFLVELPNPQACSMLKKCIRDNMEEFSQIRAGPRVAISFVQPNVPGQRVYTFEDVPRLAQYSASLYATTEEERVKYFQHYSSLYTQELVLGNPINVALPEDNVAPAPTPLPIQNPGVPNGTDDRQWPVPNINAFTYDHNSGYYYDHFTGLYYESSSQYFYNMETGKFLQYDLARSTYVLVQNSEISSAPVKSTTLSIGNVADSQTLGVIQDGTNPKSNVANKESKIHAKKVLKDLEKWSKTVKKQDKKKAIANVSNQALDATEKSSPADVGFDILRRTETSSKPSTSSSVPTISSLIMEPTFCEDEEEEYAFIDWKNFTCNLCHRVFNNADVLSKHSKLSDLHRNNLKQWYISKNLDPENEDNRKQQYRDRASERRNKKGKGVTSSQEVAESWLCNTPGCMSYKKSGFDVCFSCERSQDSRNNTSFQTQSVPGISLGSQLLKKMGWEQGTGLGKMSQGSKSPIKVDRQSGYRGLGAQREEYKEDNESYTAFIKRSTQKRYQELSRRE